MMGCLSDREKIITIIRKAINDRLTRKPAHKPRPNGSMKEKNVVDMRYHSEVGFGR